MKRAASVIPASVENQEKRHKKDIVATTALSPAEWAAASVQRGFPANDKPFRAAIVGAPGSGKGTFINAIVGEKFMPSGGFRDTNLSAIRVDIEHVKKFYGENEAACDCGVFDIFLVHTDGSAVHCFCKSAEIARSYLADFVPSKPLERVVVRTYIENCDGSANSIVLSKFPCFHVKFSDEAAASAIAAEDFRFLAILSQYDNHMAGGSKFIEAAARRVPALVANSTVYITKWDRANEEELQHKHYLIEEAQSVIHNAVDDTPADEIDVYCVGKRQYDSSFEFLETFWESIPFEMEEGDGKSEAEAAREAEDEAEEEEASGTSSDCAIEIPSDSEDDD